MRGDRPGDYGVGRGDTGRDRRRGGDHRWRERRERPFGAHSRAAFDHRFSIFLSDFLFVVRDQSVVVGARGCEFRDGLEDLVSP